jgi:RND family efflux transporter MFP subunit
MNHLSKNILRLAFLLAAGTTLSCSHNHAAEEEKHEEHDHEGVIVLDPHQAEKIGLKTETVVKSSFSPAIKVGGKVLAANGNEKTVAATTNGLVTYSGNLYEGNAVRAGQTLFSISSKGVENGDPIEKARLDLANAESELKRAEELVQKQIISQKEFEQIKLRRDLARESLSGMGLKKSGSGMSVAANQSGFIKQILVRPGDYVTVGQPLAIITQNQKLQIRAEVSERHYTFLNQVRSANFRTEASQQTMCLDSIGGRLLSSGKSMPEGTFYVPVIFECNNVGNILSGSFAEIWLLGNEQREALTVPLTALTEEQGVFFVYVQKDKEHYEKREVKTGGQDGVRIEILKGIQPNEKVVTQGAIHVKLASQSGTIPEGHNHNH